MHLTQIAGLGQLSLTQIAFATKLSINQVADLFGVTVGKTVGNAYMSLNYMAAARGMTHEQFIAAARDELNISTVLSEQQVLNLIAHRIDLSRDFLASGDFSQLEAAISSLGFTRGNFSEALLSQAVSILASAKQQGIITFQNAEGETVRQQIDSAAAFKVISLMALTQSPVTDLARQALVRFSSVV